jgi:hypothetical protein
LERIKKIPAITIKVKVLIAENFILAGFTIKLLKKIINGKIQAMIILFCHKN